MAGNKDDDARPAKDGLLGKVQGALGKLQEATDRLIGPGPKPPAPARARVTGPLMAGDSARLSARGALSGTARRRGTGLLASDSAPSGHTGPVAPPAPKTRAERVQSDKRLRFIEAYVEDPTSDPLFEDKAFVYKVLSDERAFQQDLILLAAAALQKLPRSDSEAVRSRRQALEAEIATRQRRQARLFLMLKQLLGIHGKSGGTGFRFTLKPGQDPTDGPPGP